MIAMRDLDIPHDRINVNGGATALGIPSVPAARGSLPRWWRP